MNRIGFPRSTMPEEGRVALLPEDVRFILDPDKVFVEKGYAFHLGRSDREYQNQGVNIVSREEMSDLEVLCIPKRWYPDEKLFSKGQTLTGWLYLPESIWLSEILKEKQMSAIAWEKFYDNGNYVFRENRLITGRAGMLHALGYVDSPPENLQAAVLGRGLVSMGAQEMLEKLKVPFSVYGRNNIGDFYEWIAAYDLIINCTAPAPDEFVLDDVHFESMKKDCFVINLSMEGIRGCYGTPSIRQPLTEYKGIRIYVNEHIPTLWARAASVSISRTFAPLVNNLIIDNYNPILEAALEMKGGIMQESVVSIK